jgi:ParB/RepB/Spo0J family partition protein
MPAKKVGKQPGAAHRTQTLPINKLLPTPDNRRKAISNASLSSLAQSIRKEGLLQPIVARAHPTKPDHWEIRAGERRWRAAKLAGLKTIPVIVRTLDDEAALAVTLAENLQRKDLSPLEEAETIQLAFERDYDVKAVAAKLGKSIQYVTRRASLTRLAPAWKAEIKKSNSEAGRLSAAHLELIARLPEATQNALAEDNFYPVFGRGFPSVDELRRLIDRDLRSLSAMAWDPNDETLVPEVGACSNCDRRASMQKWLFPEAASSNGKSLKTDRCLDFQCFDRKHVTHVQRCETQLRGEHASLRLVQLGIGSLSPGVQHAFGESMMRVYSPTIVKAGHPHATPALPIDGPKAGKLIYLDLGEEPGSRANSRNGRPRDAGGKVVPLTPVERRERLQRRRDAFVVNRVKTFLAELTPESAKKSVTAAEAKGKKPGPARKFDALALLVTFGTAHKADFCEGEDVWTEYKKLSAVKVNQKETDALMAVVPVWARRLNAPNNDRIAAQAEDAHRMCEILGIDFEELQDEAVKAIPEPKPWASLTDDGESLMTREVAAAS